MFIDPRVRPRLALRQAVLPTVPSVRLFSPAMILFLLPFGY